MDIGFLRMLPNMVLAAPADGLELKSALTFALKSQRPVAIRYPKDTVPSGPVAETSSQPFELAKSVKVFGPGGCDVVIVAYGSIVTEAVHAAKILAKEHIGVDVINARFAKPIDPQIIALAVRGKNIITVEDHRTSAGFGSALLEAVNRAALGKDVAAGRSRTLPAVTILAAPDEFIVRDSRSAQLGEVGISAGQIALTVKKMRAQVDKKVSSGA